MKKAKKVAKKTLRSELDSARKALDGLQRLKLVLPMLEAHRVAIDNAIATVRFAWRNHKLETKVGDVLTLADYADKILTRLPKQSWRIINDRTKLRHRK